VHAILCTALNLYFIALFARIILSWFPISPGSAMAGVFSFLYTITEPVLGPVRRRIPPLGMFDLSPLIVILGVQILGSAVLGCRVGLF
jgi:YggT family protein